LHKVGLGVGFRVGLGVGRTVGLTVGVPPAPHGTPTWHGVALGTSDPDGQTAPTGHKLADGLAVGLADGLGDGLGDGQAGPGTPTGHVAVADGDGAAPEAPMPGTRPPNANQPTSRVIRSAAPPIRNHGVPRRESCADDVDTGPMVDLRAPMTVEVAREAIEPACPTPNCESPVPPGPREPRRR
jgi:hypothetical protein